MKKLIAAPIALLATLSVSAQGLPESAPKYENAIQVTGKSEKEITPDEIYVRITISENDTKGKTSVQKMENDMVAKLVSLGIDVDENLKVGDMASSFKEYRLKRNETRTTATYQLKVNSATMLASVYSALESIGISNMNVIRSSHSRLKEYQAEARREAILNAQSIAADLAGAIGQKIGKAVWIMDYNNDVVADQVMVRAAYAAGPAESATQLDFRSIKIRYSVQAKFILQ